MSQKQLSELLDMDSTTLTRTLAPLRQKGWVRFETGRDRRELRLLLEPAGIQEFERALPYWESAQTQLRGVLGEANWQQTLRSATLLAEVTPKPD